MIKKCAHCKLLSDETATRCDCGFDFTTGQMPASSGAQQRPTTARRDLVTGVALFLVAYAIQLLAIPVKSLALNLASLVIYGVSFLYLVRSLIAWLGGRRNKR